jgi:hypothetical protein
MSMLGLIRRAMTGWPGTAVFALIALLLSVTAWWATSWLMLRGEVRWRPLLATACLTALATNIYAASASVWMPRTIRQNELQFGFFGIALALVTWLVGMSFLIVAAACTGAVLADDSGAVGRLVRGEEASALVAGAPPPQQPGPTSLRGAFGGDADADMRGDP